MTYLSNLDPPVHGGRIKETAEKENMNPEELLDFSVNLNPLAPPESVEKILKNSVNSLISYPDNRYKDFREAVSVFLENVHNAILKSDNIIPGNGSLEIIRFGLQLISNLRDEVSALIPAPTFSEYAYQACLFDINVDRIKYSELLNLSEDRLKEFDVVFLCNPNNPTGELIDNLQLEGFLAKCSKFLLNFPIRMPV